MVICVHHQIHLKVSVCQDAVLKGRRVPEELKQPTGKVVGIIKRNWRQYCGIIQKSLIKGVRTFCSFFVSWYLLLTNESCFVFCTGVKTSVCAG